MMCTYVYYSYCCRYWGSLSEPGLNIVNHGNLETIGSPLALMWDRHGPKPLWGRRGAKPLSPCGRRGAKPLWNHNDVNGPHDPSLKHRDQTTGVICAEDGFKIAVRPSQTPSSPFKDYVSPVLRVGADAGISTGPA